MSAATTPHTGTEERFELVERLLAADGTRITNPQLDSYVAEFDAVWLRGLYRDMSLLRRIDAEGVALQRQGQLGLWAPCQGQEASQIGTVRALHNDDFIFPSYRELGIVYARGGEPGDFVRVWRGVEGAGYDPFELNVAPMQIIIGAQSLHAAGYALGIKHDGGKQVAVAYFGDGATSQGDVHEAMVFASAYQAPAIFVCQNNHWAISEPVALQSRYPIAGRAPGYGIPSLRVDGNDVLACFAAMRWAADHARDGGGPVFIETVTYRMGPHTTADDPTRYRSSGEVEMWRDRDPLTRVAAFLRKLDALSDEQQSEIDEEADRLARQMRAACLEMPVREPLQVFDHVYAEPHRGIDEQRDAYAAYLADFEEAAK